jgi:hypothetical protein
MNWDGIVPHIVKLGAPLLGQAIGGPFGAVAGKILAEAFGANDATPAAVAEALSKSDPAVAASTAREAEARWLDALAEIGQAQVSQVAETQRAEMTSEDLLQRWWRPIYALELTLFECPGFAFLTGHALWIGKTEIINGLATLSGLIMTYMAARFGVLGVYVSGRSREKQTFLTGETAPSVLGEVVKTLVRRKG